MLAPLLEGEIKIQREDNTLTFITRAGQCTFPATAEILAFVDKHKQQENTRSKINTDTDSNTQQVQVQTTKSCFHNDNTAETGVTPPTSPIGEKTDAAAVASSCALISDSKSKSEGTEQPLQPSAARNAAAEPESKKCKVHNEETGHSTTSGAPKASVNFVATAEPDGQSIQHAQSGLPELWQQRLEADCAEQTRRRKNSAQQTKAVTPIVQPQSPVQHVTQLWQGYVISIDDKGNCEVAKIIDETIALVKNVSERDLNVVALKDMPDNRFRTLFRRKNALTPGTVIGDWRRRHYLVCCPAEHDEFYTVNLADGKWCRMSKVGTENLSKTKSGTENLARAELFNLQPGSFVIKDDRVGKVVERQKPRQGDLLSYQVQTRQCMEEWSAMGMRSFNDPVENLKKCSNQQQEDYLILSGARETYDRVASFIRKRIHENATPLLDQMTKALDKLRSGKIDQYVTQTMHNVETFRKMAFGWKCGCAYSLKKQWPNETRFITEWDKTFPGCSWKGSFAYDKASQGELVAMCSRLVFVDSKILNDAQTREHVKLMISLGYKFE